jgi:phosphoglycolate phosphatase-like HAD superfamily hydrolase
VGVEALATWNEGAAKEAILGFVERACAEGPGGVPPEERVAVFDNDGTLWCEKPMPIQLDFILRRLAEMAAGDPELRGRQPWKSAHEKDHAWLTNILAEHYAGNDSNVRVLAGGLLAAFANITVEEFEDKSEEFLRTTQHPLLGRGYLDCAYAPMVDLLAHLTANGFSNYIVSGGGRDFMRPITQELYGVPRQRVIGSSTALTYVPDSQGGSIVRQAAADYLDDGPEKPVRIWTRTGRRPILAAGNSNGDIEMLDFTQHPEAPTLRLLVLHDDPEREYDYTAGAERALDLARRAAWTVVSMKDDWATVF